MRTSNPVRPTAMAESRALLDAIASTQDRGGSTPCLNDPEPFTSDDQLERAEAAAACQYCPALAPCREFSQVNAEPAHVWAGIDRTPTTRSQEVSA